MGFTVLSQSAFKDCMFQNILQPKQEKQNVVEEK